MISFKRQRQKQLKRKTVNIKPVNIEHPKAANKLSKPRK